MAKKSGGMVGGKIVMDVKDWVEYYDEVEPDMTGDNPIIDMALNGLKPKDAGKIIVIAGERGELEDYPGSKNLLNSGASLLYSAVIVKEKRKIKLQNGKEYQGRVYVAPVRDDDGEGDDHPIDETQASSVQSSAPSHNWLEEKVIETSNKEAVERYEKYIFTQITGNIWSRLLLIAEHDQKRMEDTAEALKLAIDEMVDKLS